MSDKSKQRKARPSDDTAGEKPFRVVAVGASAGGLQAFKAFLGELRKGSGMAFILAQHLDPKSRSELVPLLQGDSALPVVRAEDAQRLEPDTVYVLPPNRSLTLSGEHLKLGELAAGSSPRVIDRLFRSLAEELGPRAVAVVLSGTGSDGTLGLKAVKEQGGVTLAQAEADASYAGMPQSAVRSGQVDLVLRASEMPAKLLDLKEVAVKLSAPAPEELPSSEADALNQIFARLRVRTGHDFSRYKRSSVLRRLTKRMQVVGITELSEYLARLQKDETETAALLKELLISVTYFFRDPEAFAALEEVLPVLFEARREVGALRVWVPGCASGEEVYSLAMLFAEHNNTLDKPLNLQFFASDIDEAALATARAGLYSEAALSELSAEQRKRWFDPAGDDFRVKTVLRETILFAKQNLIHDPPFSNLDLISCRNVLIYLTQELQERLFRLFHFALNTQGYLFLGTSESLGEAAAWFSTVDARAKLFKRRAVAPPPVQQPSSPLPTEEGGAVPSALPARAWEVRAQELVLRHTSPVVIVNDANDVLYIAGRTGEYLEPAPGQLSRNLVEMAREGLRHELRAALFQALHHAQATERKRVMVKANGGLRALKLSVRPLRDPELGPIALVRFEDAADSNLDPSSLPEDTRADPLIAQLEGELKDTKASLQRTIEALETHNEELQAANEELQSINEEQRSTAEELEASQEELQSTNEELLTLNQELRVKNEELTRTNSDLENLFVSTDIITLFLDQELNLRRFTPKASEVFNLVPGDVGRPISHLTHQLRYNTLVKDAEKVLKTLETSEREVKSDAGDWYQLRMLPYRTVDGRVDGVVLTLSDVSERRRAEAQLSQAIGKVLEDSSWFGRAVTERLANIRSGQEAPPALADLTRRESEVLVLIAQGLDNEEIGAQLSIAQSTVRNYVSGIYSKLGVASRAEAVVWARERGLVF